MRQPAGVPRQLFPPPELLGDDVDQLLLDEGESDTGRGLARPASPRSECRARRTGTTEWADRFSGRRWTIYVCGDCDKAGRDFANRAAASLAAAGVDARIVELDPARDDGYDLTELLRERGADALRELIDAAEPYARGADEPAGARFPGLSHLELLALERAAARAGRRADRSRHAGTIAGLPETFKSWIALATALRVAAGGNVLGREVLTTGPVGYWWQDDSSTTRPARPGIRPRTSSPATCRSAGT